MVVKEDWKVFSYIFIWNMYRDCAEPNTDCLSNDV